MFPISTPPSCTRMLDAGAEIAGKAHCESFCMSGGSHTNATGAGAQSAQDGLFGRRLVLGQRASLVALGEVDMAIGGDQGGSIRMPSSFCGTYGMKPTWGLVPYTGIMPIEIFVDHTGPMTATVADNALLLEVLAGDDGYDPRQSRRRRSTTTPRRSAGGVKGMKIGIVKEGFEQAERRGRRQRQASARPPSASRISAPRCETVSIPMHLVGAAIWTPIGTEGMTQTMMYGDGYGVSRPDLYSTSADGFPSRLAPAGQRAVRDHKAVPAARHLHQQQFRPPLLRQGAEHLAPPDRGLRQGVLANTTCCCCRPRR